MPPSLPRCSPPFRLSCTPPGGPDGGQLEDTVRLLGRELARPQIATSLVLERLVDVLLVQALRQWLAGNPVREPCWLGVLCDDTVGTAAALLHSDPARAWTTGALARDTGVSRSTLSRRFAMVSGETPGTYLKRWRMDLAARRLRDTDDSLEAVAHSVGYTSVYAFSRAFSPSAPGASRAVPDAGTLG